MKRLLIITLALALPAAVVAQDFERGDRSDRPERRQRRFDRDDFRGGDRMGRGGVQRQSQRIVEALGLDDQQRVQFDDIIADYTQRMQEQGEVFREIREANQAGDKERAAELRSELGELGGGRGNPMTRILDELEPILRQDQMEAFKQLRERTSRGGMGRDTGRRGRRGIDGLIEQLDLTEEQQREFVEIRRENSEQQRNRWEDIRPLMDEMREAREAGDEQRLDEIRAQFEEMRAGNRRGGGNEVLLDALRDILDDDQRSILEEYREQNNRRFGRDDRRRREPDVRSIIQAAKRLDLDSVQKDDLREIEQVAGREQREVRRDREALAELTARVRREIMDILDDDQKREFERAIERNNRRGGDRRSRRDRDRPDREERPQRGSDRPFRP